MTGNVVMAAVIPGRWAAPPAPAIITFNPLSCAVEAYSYILSGVLWAETMVSSYSIPKESKTFAASLITGKSESLPIISPPLM